MEDGSFKGRIIGTLAIGAFGVLAFAVLTRGASPSASASPTPSPTPHVSPTALAATALHATLVARPADPTIAVGQTATVQLSFKNTGTATWTKGAPSELRLGVQNDDKTFTTAGMAVNWALDTRPAVQQEPSVEPGASATFSFQVKGVRPGTYTLNLRPVVDGVAWLEDPNLIITFTVR